MPTLKVTLMGDVQELEVEFPATYEVCTDCRGEGRTLLDGLRGAAFTREDFDREFDDEAREAYFDSSSHYHRDCRTCGGKRVELQVDRGACQADRRLRRYLALWNRQQGRRNAWDAEDRRTRMMEMGMHGSDWY